MIELSRPLLLGGTALLGVASSLLVGNVTLTASLLGVGSLSFMYVGDVGRTVEDVVKAHLPRDSSIALVRETLAHELQRSGRLKATCAALGLGVVCLAGALIATLAPGTDAPTPRPPTWIDAPARYRLGSLPLEVRVSCPRTCAVNATLERGRTTRQLLELNGIRNRVRIQLTIPRAPHGRKQTSDHVIVRVYESNHRTQARMVTLVP